MKNTLIDFETFAEIRAELHNSTQHNEDNVTFIIGDHPRYGTITLVPDVITGNAVLTCPDADDCRRTRLIGGVFDRTRPSKPA
jgi:hypothetical protein